MARSREVTHNIMAAVKSRDTRPEFMLRRALWARGYRYRVNAKSLPGKPDIVFSKARVVIFCDGDFWHGHNWAIRGLPSLEAELENYDDYWRSKITRNVQRDVSVTSQLELDSWLVLRFWSSTIRGSLDECIEEIAVALEKRLSGNREEIIPCNRPK